MLINPQRAQEEFDLALAKIRAATRMRIGIIAGIVIVGLFHTDFDGLSGIEAYARAMFPVIGLAAVGVFVVVSLRFRDVKKARDRLESQTFRVPKRKSRS